MSTKTVVKIRPLGTVQLLLILVMTMFFLAACSREEEAIMVVPEGARAGELTMEPCTLEFENSSFEAECGTLVVPENRSNPNSRLIALPVQRYRASRNDSAEPVFFLWGGPGSTNISPQPPQPWLLNNYDLIAVGYRGVDGSVILDLPEVSQALKGSGGDLLGDESLDALGEAIASGAQRLKQEGIDLAGYTIPEVVADMEAARVGLGYDRINLFTHSYGTRVAQIYSWQHPDSLDRVLMLSANPPGRLVWEPEMADEQLAHYARLCAEDVECNQRTPDLTATVHNVMNNMPSHWGLIPIDPGRVKIATFLLLSNTFTANLIFDTLIAAEQGDPSGLALLSLGYTVQFDIPHILTWGNLFAIAHSADFDPERNYRAEMDPADSILGAPFSLLYWSEAHNWPHRPIPDELRHSQVSDVETLVVAGSIDFSAPKEFVIDELLPYLENGQLVVISEAGHDGFYAQEEAFAHLVNTFYQTGAVDDSLFKYQPMDFSVELPFTEMARGMVRQFVIYPLAALTFIFVLIGWGLRRKRRRQKERIKMEPSAQSLT